MNAFTQYLFRHALTLAVTEIQAEVKTEGPALMEKAADFVAEELANLQAHLEGDTTAAYEAPTPAAAPEPTPAAGTVAQSPRAAAAEPVVVGTNVKVH